MNGDTDGSQVGASVGAGYDINSNALTIGLYGRLHYLDADIDAYAESGSAPQRLPDGSLPQNGSELALAIADQNFESLQSALGVDFRWVKSLDFGVVQPYLRTEWRHEFDNGSRNIAAVFVNDPFQTGFAVPSDEADSDYFLLGIGTTLVLKSGLQLFFDYETTLGLEDISSHLLTIGFRTN